MMNPAETHLMRMRWLLLFLVPGVFCFQIAELCAQDYLVHTYDENDGLLSSTVYDVAQDDMGQMWFATRRGISCYDGLQWTSYTEYNGLPATSYARIRVDRQGTIWALSQAPRLVVAWLDGTIWRSFPQLPGSFSFGEITAFDVFTSASGQTVAVGTRNAGLWLYGNGHWSQLTVEDGLPSEHVHGVAFLEDRGYVVTDRGLSVVEGGRVDNELNTTFNFPSLDMRGITIEAENGASSSTAKIWLHGRDWLGYIRDDGFHLLSGESDVPFDMLFQSIVLEADHAGGVYYGNPYKLMYRNLAGTSIASLGRNNGLLSEGATSLLIDREKNLWVTSLRGISKIASRRFANFHKEHGLLENEVTAVIERRPGSIVFGHNDGLTFMDEQGFRALSFTGGAQPAYPGTRVFDLRLDRSGNIWVAAAQAGLAVVRSGGGIRWYGEDEGLKGIVTSVLPDAVDGMLVTSSTGLYVLGGERFVPVRTGDLPAAYLRRIVQGPDGSIFLATTAQGIYVGKDGIWSQYTHPSSQAANSVFAITVDSQKRVWVGTIAGLYALQGQSLQKIETPSLSIDRPVYLIVEDEKHRLWIGTDNGVVRWDGENAREYTTLEGFAGREVNRAAGMVDSRGQLWIGTDMGISRYQEENDLDPGTIPPPVVALEGLDVAGMSYVLSVPNEFNHDHNDLTLHFRAISFIDESKVQCRCRLLGHGDDWEPLLPSTQRQIRFAALSPGHYAFQIQARNALGVWSPVRSSALISINKPYWMQWWFFSLAAMIIGLALLGVARYVSEKRYAVVLEKQIRERTVQLRESETKYRNVVEQSLQGIAIARDFPPQLLFANKALANIAGYTIDQLQSSSPGAMAQLIHPEDRHLFFMSYWQCLEEDPPPNRYEVRGIRRDGTTRWLEIVAARIEYEGRPAVQATFADIHERKQAEEALRESERKYKELVDHSVGGIYITQNHILKFCNQRFADIFGYGRPEELTGKHINELVEPADWALVDAQVKARESGKKDMAQYEFKGIRKDGELVDIGVLGGRIMLEGKPAIQGTLLDISERKRLAQERELVQEQLLQSEKLSSLGQLISGVAHELNNPLTSVLGFSQLLLMSPHLPEDAKKSLETINHEAERARKIIQSLLIFARQRKPEKRPIRITEVIERVLDLRAYEQRVNNIEIVRNSAPDVPLIVADEHQLQQVFMNLVINAEQAMMEAHGRGRLEVAWEHKREEREVHISFRDDGPGISEQNLPRIFEPFFTTKPVGKGTGLGLSISHSLIEEHGGRIDVESKTGKGAVFTVILPVPDSDALQVVT